MLAVFCIVFRNDCLRFCNKQRSNPNDVENTRIIEEEISPSRSVAIQTTRQNSASRKLDFSETDSENDSAGIISENVSLASFRSFRTIIEARPLYKETHF